MSYLPKKKGRKNVFFNENAFNNKKTNLFIFTFLIMEEPLYTFDFTNQHVIYLFMYLNYASIFNEIHFCSNPFHLIL